MCQGQSEILSKFHGKHKSLPDMSFEFFKKVVDHYKEAVNISLVGSGEPLMNKNFFEMVKYAKSVRRTRVTSLSNGIINKKNIELLLQSGLDSISISIKGYNREDFYRLTGVDKIIFDEVINNIKHLITIKKESQSRLDIYGSFIIDKQNYQYITDMIELAQILGMDKVKFDAFLPYPYNLFTVAERCILSRDQDIMKFLKNIKYNKYSIKIRPLKILDFDKPSRMCRTPFTSIRIDSSGNVGGCNVKLLNLENNGKYSEPDAWNNVYFKNIRQIFLNTDLNQIPEDCMTCYEYAGESVS
jgi:MoaA/NifB/PqqE/SkfB family radical SAM enzyme